MSSRPAARTVFILFASLYWLCIGRGFYSSDGDVMFKTTAALAQQHRLALAPNPGLPQIVAGKDHRFYSKYDPGLALIGVPFYTVGDWIARTNHAHRYRVTILFYLLIPVLAAAGTLAALAACCGSEKTKAIQRRDRRGRGDYLEERETGLPTNAFLRSSLIVRSFSAISAASALNPFFLFFAGGEVQIAILAAGLATPLWVYARTLYAEAVLACALAWAVYGVCRAGGAEQTLPLDSGCSDKRAEQALPLRRERVVLFLAGMVFGIGLLTRAALAIYLPALAVILIRHAPDRRLRPLAIRLACFGAGALPAVALLLGHNALRFGDPLHFGYAGEGFTTLPWKGIAGLLFSPGKSVFLYAPPLVLCAALWPRFRRINPALGDFLALAWGTALLFYGSWWAWDGGWCWGPRFLVPLIPLSCLPLTILPDRRAWRVAAGVAILIGIGVQVGGVITDIIPHYADISAGQAADVDRLNFSLDESPLAEAIRRVAKGQTEPLGMFHLDETGLPATWTAGIPALLIAGVIVGIWGMMEKRAEGSTPRPCY